MSDIRIKMAKDLRDMSDMVGDLHWMAAKAVEDLTKKDGEIAKRDEELAACRVAVENCELFRARIAELEDLVISLQCKAIESDDLRAELAAIKAQEPVAFVHLRDGEVDYDSEYVISNEQGDCLDESHEWRPVYAAPVSEAKAQGVVMLGRDAIREVFMRNGFTVKEGQADLKPYVYAAAEELLRLAAPVQQVSVPDGLELIKRMQVCLSLDDTEWGLSAPEKYKLLGDIKSYVLAAPAAPAADAGLVEALKQAFPLFDEDGLNELYHHCEIAVLGDRKRLHKLLATHRAKRVV